MRDVHGFSRKPGTGLLAGKSNSCTGYGQRVHAWSKLGDIGAFFDWAVLPAFAVLAVLSHLLHLIGWKVLPICLPVGGFHSCTPGLPSYYGQKTRLCYLGICLENFHWVLFAVDVKALQVCLLINVFFGSLLLDSANAAKAAVFPFDNFLVAHLADLGSGSVLWRSLLGVIVLCFL